MDQAFFAGHAELFVGHGGSDCHYWLVDCAALLARQLCLCLVPTRFQPIAAAATAAIALTTWLSRWPLNSGMQNAEAAFCHLTQTFSLSCLAVGSHLPGPALPLISGMVLVVNVAVVALLAMVQLLACGLAVLHLSLWACAANSECHLNVLRVRARMASFWLACARPFAQDYGERRQKGARHTHLGDVEPALRAAPAGSDAEARPRAAPPLSIGCQKQRVC